MSESSSEREIFGAKWAARLCLAMLVGLGVVTGVALYEDHRLSGLETTEENTAVGDKAFFSIAPEAATANPAGPVVKFNGVPLTPVSFKEYKGRDSQMVRKGLDDTKQFSIYSSTAPVKALKGEAVKGGETYYFLKLGVGKYLKLKG